MKTDKAANKTTHAPGRETMMETNCACRFISERDGKDLDVLFCPVHAAAPELLAALKSMSESYEHDDLKMLGRANDAARAAIAKAEGK